MMPMAPAYERKSVTMVKAPLPLMMAMPKHVATRHDAVARYLSCSMSSTTVYPPRRSKLA